MIPIQFSVWADGNDETAAPDVVGRSEDVLIGGLDPAGESARNPLNFAGRFLVNSSTKLIASRTAFTLA